MLRKADFLAIGRPIFTTINEYGIHVNLCVTIYINVGGIGKVPLPLKKLGVTSYVYTLHYKRVIHIRWAVIMVALDMDSSHALSG